VLVGGLFDHLNNADKTMLTLGALVAERNVTVAVAEGPDMLQHIEFKSLLQSYGQRVTAVEGFVRLINPDIKVTITPMFTPLGPAADLRDLECIVIDQEDTEAAAAVNAARAAKGWQNADLLSLDLSYYPEGKPTEEEEEHRYLYVDSLYGEQDVHLRQKPIVVTDSVDARAAKAARWVSQERLAGYA